MIRTAPKQIDIEEITSMNIAANPVPSLAELQNMEVHPMAARFPMWTRDRLNDLAEDIAANGQHIPLVVWRADGDKREADILLDGRNRLAACSLKDIQPKVEFFDGDDPRKLIISRNIQTREMTASQKAMLLAIEFPEPEKGGRGKKSEAGNDRQTLGFDPMVLSRARDIVKWAPELSDSVASGFTKFSEAHNAATEAKRKAASKEARIERLREEDPKLARQVVEDELTLEGAEAEIISRKKIASDRKSDGEAAVRRMRGIAADILAVKTAIKFGAEGIIDASLAALFEAAAVEIRALLSSQETEGDDE